MRQRDEHDADGSAKATEATTQKPLPQGRDVRIEPATKGQNVTEANALKVDIASLTQLSRKVHVFRAIAKDDESSLLF